MKKLVLVLFMMVFNCSEEDNTLCNSYCNDWLISYQNNAKGCGCYIDKSAQKDYISDCNNSCQNAIYSMDKELVEEIEACVECIHNDLTESCVPKDFDTLMRGNCQFKCSTLGCKQFFTTFFVVEPDFTCENNND